MTSFYIPTLFEGASGAGGEVRLLPSAGLALSTIYQCLTCGAVRPYWAVPRPAVHAELLKPTVRVALGDFEARCARVDGVSGGRWVSGLGEGLGALRGAGLARGWGLGALGAHAGGAHYAIICISYLGDVTVTSSAKTGSCPKQEPLFRRVSWWTSEFLGRQVTQHRSRNGVSVFCCRHTCVIVVTCALFRRYRRR